MDLKTLLEFFNQYFTLYAIFPGIMALGLYLTLKLNFVQLRQLKKSFICLTERNLESEGNISRFKAISTVLAGNFGTGNISGMAIAISTGGPGALVWMWVMAFFGAAIQYASCILGITYRTKNAAGEYVGGPMYYLRDGLGYNKLSAAFAVFTIFGAITVGNFAQTNSLLLPLQQMGFAPLPCSIVIAALIGIVILGGITRVASFASLVVPFKAVLYLGTAFIIVALHYDQVPAALKLMFDHALGFSQIAGGVAGYGALKALTTGFDRGVFATDAGTGIVPILQASARSQHPVMDGVASLIAPFLVMIVCTTTGLVIILTGAWLDPTLQSTNMVTYAFTKGLGSAIGGYIVIVALVLFAYTTLLAWSYCGEKAAEFLVGPKYARWFRYVYIILVPVGGMLQVDMIWTLADVSITLMLFINLIGITALSKYVIVTSREYQTA
ncbi:MAG: sodium:alanine symporter family protein [Parachlamydiaceae bacterium]|nr:sodium:alanine symporter family protein [Parachlamydiaceae bacterium]